MFEYYHRGLKFSFCTTLFRILAFGGWFHMRRGSLHYSFRWKRPWQDARVTWWSWRWYLYCLLGGIHFTWQTVTQRITLQNKQPYNCTWTDLRSPTIQVNHKYNGNLMYTDRQSILGIIPIRLQLHVQPKAACVFLLEYMLGHSCRESLPN